MYAIFCVMYYNNTYNNLLGKAITYTSLLVYWDVQLNLDDVSTLVGETGMVVKD